MVLVFGVLNLKIILSNVFGGRGQLHLYVKSKGTGQNMVQRLSFLSIKEHSMLSEV